MVGIHTDVLICSPPDLKLFLLLPDLPEAVLSTTKVYEQ